MFAELKTLDNIAYTLLTDSQDVQAVLESCGVPKEFRANITGAYVKVGDGDYDDVWLSESNSPWNLSAIYHPLSFYTAQ